MDTHFFAGLSKFKLDAGKFRRDDDFADRFSHTFTTLLLVIFTLVISARQYIEKPIACWVPTEFTRAQEEYAESACWVTQTYYIDPNSKSVPTDNSSRYGRLIHYYQWVPFILMLKAFLFNLPCIVWRLFNWQSGKMICGITTQFSLASFFQQLSSIMEVACDIEMIKDPESRKSNVTYVARHIEDALNTQREYRVGCSVKFRHCLAKTCCLWFGKRYGNYLIFLYIAVKMFYISNVIGQFLLMDRFLGTEHRFFGINLLYNLSRGIEWSHSGNFPRVTLCDFTIRKVGGNLHQHTVQCVLPINMLNEKIFIFLWFWYILVAAVCFSSFFHWTYKCTFRVNRIQFIRKFLKLRDALEPGNKKKSYAFVDDFLRPDGVFILRLVAQNAGELVASEIVERMWQIYKQALINPTLIPLTHEEKISSRKSSSKLPTASHTNIGFQLPPPLPPQANGSSTAYNQAFYSFPPPLPPHPSSSAPMLIHGSTTGPGSSVSTTTGSCPAPGSGISSSELTSGAPTLPPMTLRPQRITSEGDHKKKQTSGAKQKNKNSEEDNGDFV